MCKVKQAPNRVRTMRADGQWRKYGKRWTEIRKIVLRRDDCTCIYCGASIYDTPGLVLEADHVVPFAEGGGEYDLDNVVTACFDCNRTHGGGRKPAHIERAVLKVVAARNRRYFAKES